MSRVDQRNLRNESEDARPPRGVSDRAARVLLLFGGGLLLSVLVSCACGPVR
jgi:hypothetical protein